MLKLRRGTVVAMDPLTVEVAGKQRRAWADAGLVGPVERGDEVIVNVEAADLGLGSGRLRRRAREPHPWARRRRAPPAST